ncbi:hypothetical protein [Longimicrobium sp.]|jgi:hypothetical protein|uniref:hypothetical protein n=1 Tax=Longimicrobium sp. TaxID=2029185 RepID=UPI002F9245E4
MIPIFRVLLVSAFAASGLSAQQGASLHGTWEGEMKTSRWPQFFIVTLRADSSTVETLGRSFPADEARLSADSFAVRVGAGEGAAIFRGVLREGRLVGALTQGRDTLPFTLRRIPDYPEPANRVQAWEQDIDALSTRFIELDRSFSPDERSRFLAHLADTRSRLAELNDNEVIVRLGSAIALAGNAHTRLYLLRNATELRRLPIRLWWFSDGLYVVRTAPAHRALLGCRVDTIGGTGARQARVRVAPLFAGNASWTEYKSVYSLTSPQVLNGFGIIPTADSVNLGISGCGDGSRGRVVLKPLPLTRSERAVEAWWDLSPRHPGADSTWVQALAGADSLPLYLRNPRSNYWFQYLPESGVMYFQYNRSQNAADETTAQFGDRLLAAVEQHRPKAFVMDVRFNTGGNLTLAADLMKRLVERTAGMRRFVITGRATFSAGITQVATWRQAGDVTIVGEPVGDDLEMWAEGGNVRLPNSGFNAHFANGLHSYTPAPCPAETPCHDLSASSVAPDLPATASWADYRAGRDPAMAAILARVGGR